MLGPSPALAAHASSKPSVTGASALVTTHHAALTATSIAVCADGWMCLNLPVADGINNLDLRVVSKLHVGCFRAVFKWLIK